MSRPATPITLYHHPLSGHAHRALLMLSLLDLPCRRVNVDLKRGEQATPEFLARNPFGQVPVIEDGEFTLADSNAILVYLALRYDTRRRWLPEDVQAQAEIQRWLGVAAGPLLRGPAMARWARISGQGDGTAHHPMGRQLFERMEQHLQPRDWLVGPAPTIADVANYTYIARAPEGGLSLDAYPRLRAWLARIEALPGFTAMQATPAVAA
ncbi:MAG: glutathione S-transferase [Burkholderiales bacterium]|nr:glutathione S-transferase [Burkholderiales bacterium]